MAPTNSTSATAKNPFDIDVAIRRIRRAVRPYARAALFALADEGFDSPFEVLVACILSIRTYDEVSLPTARQLFALARTAGAMARLAPSDIDEVIRACTFHGPKAKQIHDIARRIVAEFGGAVPCDVDMLRSFRGVGPKCAHLVLGIACKQPFISVDVHVHRVTNRWGIVRTPTPERTMLALQSVLPKEYWIEINRLLVPFGKHLCTGRAPRCSRCPVLSMCRQVGVTAPR